MSVYFALARVLELYTYVLLASVLLSWVPMDRDGGLVRFLDAVTAPVLDPVRAILRPEATGGIDFSPMVVLILLQMLAQFLRSQ